MSESGSLSIWLSAWGISGIIAAAVLVRCRKAGLSGRDSCIIAAAFFPTPLGHLFGSGNSFVYAFDLLIPIAFFSASKRWERIPSRMKTAGLLILWGGGLLPALTSLGRENRFDALWNVVNLIRMAGCIAVMFQLATAKKSSKFAPNALLYCFSALSMGVFCAMLLNGTDLIKSDVFTHIQNVAASYQDSTELNLDRRFFALGLFRGSTGIIGTLGVLAFFATVSERKFSPFAAIGAVSGLGAVVLIGSKTSLLTIVVIFLYSASRSLLKRPTFQVAAAMIAFATIVVLSVGALYKKPSLRTYVPPLMLDLLGVEGRVETPTLDLRVSRWSDTQEALTRTPLALLGLGQSENLEYNVSFFHDEYLSVLALGGIPGLACYLVGMVFLWQAITWKKPVDPIVEFARLCFISGLIQGFSVANLQPALLFVECVAITCTAYGLAAASKKTLLSKGNPTALVALQTELHA